VFVAAARDLWTGAPWSLRIYVGLGAAAQLWSAVAYRTAYGAVAMLVLIGVGYLLLKGARWAWISMVVLTSVYFVLLLLAWRVVPALSYLVPLVLLLAPSTRRHFARERPFLSAVTGSRMSRLRESPLGLRLFAACLFVCAVGARAVAAVDRTGAKPGRVVAATILAAAVFGAIAYLLVRGGRIVWSIAVAILCALTALTIVAGRWPVAVVTAALLLPLLLPGSVAFVWRDRRQISV
jgi:hypothetical protein